MSVGKVSFGNVMIVAAKPGKIRRIDDKLRASKKMPKYDTETATSLYKSYYSSGKLANAAQKGCDIKLYITGDDYQKMRNKEPGWDTIEGLVSEMTAFYDGNKLTPAQIAQKIIENA